MPIEKEIITTENVISDYKFVFLKQLKLSILALIVALPSSFLIIYFFTRLSLGYKIFLGFILLLLLIFSYGASATLFREYRTLKKIKNRNFKIVTDILNQKEERIIARGNDTVRILSFNNYKEYELPKYLPLPSAQKFNFNEKELFDTSKIEDKFYLVINNKNKILLIYHTKFFEFQE
jgi:hypothetical protein